MSEQVDIKKLKKKEAVKAKRQSIKASIKRKADIVEEEKELKTNKAQYDKDEHIRRKLLKDLVSKDLTEDRFIRLYDNFYDNYMDDQGMALFMILLRLSYDYDTNGFISLINNVLRNIKSKEAGAIVKNKKAGLSNFYETSATLELLDFIKDKDRVVDKYNKKKFLDNSGEYKISERFGTIAEATKIEKRQLEKVYVDAVRLNNLWRKKVEEDIEEKGKIVFREIPYDEKELQLELDDEKKRQDILIDLSSLTNTSVGREKVQEFLANLDTELTRNTTNNNLFKELLYLYDVSDIKELNKYLEDVLESLNANHNTLLSLLEYLKDKKILSHRYTTVRKAIKDEFRTLENKYGPLDDFIDNKKMEFLSMNRGMKYQKVEKEKKEIIDKEKVKEIPDVIDVGEDIEELEGEVLKAHEQYKDIKFYPLHKNKDKGKGKISVKDKKKTPESIRIVHNLDTDITNLSREQLQLVRNVSVFFLKKFFDENSSKEMEKRVYDESKDKDLRFYLTRLGKIIILVDPDSLKYLAKLTNERLKNQYYDVYDLLNVSYKELLQDIYANPLNTDFEDLEESIELNLNKFFHKFVKFLKFVKVDEELDEDMFADYLENIHRIDTIEPCNIEFKSKSTFKKYLKLKSEYNSIDTDNQKQKLEALKLLLDEEKKIRPFLQNIIYYRDVDNLYCFSYYELEELFDEKNYVNPYTNINFSDEFIKDFQVVLASRTRRKVKESPILPEEIKENEFIKNIFQTINTLEIKLKNNIPKNEACEYYSKFVFGDSTLEKSLKKDKSTLDNLKQFCGIEKSKEVSKVPLSKPSSPSLSSLSSVPSVPSLAPQQSKLSNSSRSQLSIPSLVLGDYENKPKAKKVDISIPLMREKVKKVITDSNSDSDVSKPDEESKVSKPAEASKVSKPAEASKVSKPAEASKVNKPAEESKVSKPAEASKVSKPAEAGKKDKKKLIEQLAQQLQRDL